MSRENDRSRDVVIDALKAQIDKGVILSLEMLKQFHYGDTPSQIIYLQSNDYNELALHALTKNNMQVFDLIAESLDQSDAQKLQLKKLNKDIDVGVTPNILGTFRCIKQVETTTEESGYISGSQDNQRKNTVTEGKVDSFSLSDEDKQALVSYASKKNSLKVFEALIERLPSMQVVGFAGPGSTSEVQTAVVKEMQKRLESDDYRQVLEAEKNVQIPTTQEAKTLRVLFLEKKDNIEKARKTDSYMQRLDDMERDLKTLRKEYLGEEKGRFSWLGNKNVAKADESKLMFDEIARLKECLKSGQSSKKPWSFDSENKALATSRQEGGGLRGKAIQLEGLQKEINQHLDIQPAATAAAAKHN